MSAWKNITGSPSLRKYPRRATIHTRVDIEDDDFLRHDGMEVGEGFFAAIALLGELPGVGELRIGFTPQCAGRESEDYVMEGPDHRSELLRVMFQAVADRAGDEANRGIHKLQIENLQNCPIPEFTSSALFQSVTEKLDELHISIARENNTSAPDHDFECPELLSFPPYFLSHWLHPIASSLRHLSLYHRDNWGPFPARWDLDTLSFPKLETLSLGYYTLAYPSSTTFLLSLPSLRKLVLQNCMIASYLRFEPDSLPTWSLDTSSWVDFPFEPLDEGEALVGYVSFQYAGTWAQVFDQLATLPLLEDFRFDYGDEWKGEYGLERREQCGRRVYAERYCCFDQATLPAHWKEGDGEGEMEGWGVGEKFLRNVHKEELQGDQASLDRLVEGLRRKGSS